MLRYSIPVTIIIVGGSMIFMLLCLFITLKSVYYFKHKFKCDNKDCKNIITLTNKQKKQDDLFYCYVCVRQKYDEIDKEMK